MRSSDLELARPARAAPAERLARRIVPERANQAGRPTAVELERRKKRVMEVATELFVSHGYAATTLVDIAKGAGVATRTLYQHFGDKEALFRDVVFARDTGAKIALPQFADDDTLLAGLRRIAGYCIDMALSPRSIDLMRLMVAESNRFPELMRTVATATFARFRRNVEKLLGELERRGLMPAADHADQAEIFIDLVLGNLPILTYTNWETAPPTPAYVERRIDAFILGTMGNATFAGARDRPGEASAGSR